MEGVGCERLLGVARWAGAQPVASPTAKSVEALRATTAAWQVSAHRCVPPHGCQCPPRVPERRPVPPRAWTSPSP
eukprot:scaffold154936_cov30-Tisochrysis_lutea.AAC.1